MSISQLVWRGGVMVPIMIKFISMWSVFTGVFPNEEQHPASHSDRRVWFVHQICDREEKHRVLLNCVVIQVFYRERFCANHINCWGASSLKQKRNHPFKVSKSRVTLISNTSSIVSAVMPETNRLQVGRCLRTSSSNNKSAPERLVPNHSPLFLTLFSEWSPMAEWNQRTFHSDVPLSKV